MTFKEQGIIPEHLNKYLVQELFRMFNWYEKYNSELETRMRNVSENLLPVLENYDTNIVWADQILLSPDHWVKLNIDETTTSK